ncbi:MAG: hypothetical protein IJP11_04600 [Oscillospiraceae bacterium]|nr:hypothetical protein [Oscillospiraceae bacterium]
MDSKPKKPNQQEPPKKKPILTLAIVALVLTIVFNWIYTSIANSYLKETDYSEFM